MKWVKFKSPLHVAATGVDHQTGDVAEVSDEFAKRHGDKGTGIVEETDEPIVPVSPKKPSIKKVKKEPSAEDPGEVVPEPVTEK